MSLNRENGEIIEGRDFVFRVVPAEKYMNLPRLTTVVTETTGQKFKREINVECPIWEAALKCAQAAYAKAGAAPGGLSYDVIAQEYPREHVVAFLFCATIRGDDHYVTAAFGLADAQIAELMVTGQWEPVTIN